MSAPDSENNDGNVLRVSLKQRAGGVFFILISLLMGIMALAWWGQNAVLIALLFFVLTITDFCGGFCILFGKESKWRLAVFIVNIIVLIPLASLFLLVLVGYFTNPCYIDPMVCDDELTDTPMYLQMFGFWVAILSLVTYTSWRLRQPTMPSEIEL